MDVCGKCFIKKQINKQKTPNDSHCRLGLPAMPSRTNRGHTPHVEKKRLISIIIGFLTVHYPSQSNIWKNPAPFIVQFAVWWI